MGSWSRVGHPTTIPDGVDGLPHNHVITVRNRRISIDDANLVQNNVRTDTITLDLDSDWDGLGITVNLGECPSPFPLIWEGSPLTIPAAACAEVGGVDVSIVGVSSDGKTQVVTVESNNAFKVEKSGCVTSGDLPEDPTSLLGQVLAAAESANEAAESADTAATSANSAATAATSAAQSANAAATSATTAASSATSAASSANSAANAANAAAQSANAAAGAASDAAEAARGNVLKGTLGPSPLLSADDAYATKPRRLTVFGETRQNLWVNPSGTSNGVTVTDTEDGAMTLSGTSTDGLDIQTPGQVSLRPSTQYTVAIDHPIAGSSSSNVSFVVAYTGAPDGTPNVQFGYAGLESKTFTTPASFTGVVFRFYIRSTMSGTTVSGTYRVMLNEGSEAEPWCPPGLNGVDELSIVTAGKNLIGRTKTAISQGVTFQPTDDGGISITGMNTGSGAPIAWVNIAGTNSPQAWGYIEYAPIPPGNYTLSFDGPVGTEVRITIYSSKSVIYQEAVVSSARTSESFTLPDSYYCLAARIVGRVTGENNGTVYAQLEKGSTATDFEPYKEGTTTLIDLQGHTLNALPDGTRDELRIDGTGAVTLVQRVGVATAPTEASKWAWSTDVTGGRASFPMGRTPMSISGAQAGRILCDKLPPRTEDIHDPSYAIVAPNGRCYARNPAITSTATAAMVAGGMAVLYPLATPQEIELPPITLPTLPAPTVSVWADAEASGTGYAMVPDAEMEYERDVTKAIGGLEARVAALEEAQ